MNRLHIYARSLNIVVGAMRELKTSFLLQGFLHCEGCMTYWQFPVAQLFPVAEFAPLHSSIAREEGQPIIHLLPQSGELDELRDLNAQIGRSRSHTLQSDLYQNAPTIGKIKEYSLEYGLFGLGAEGTIPDGAPGLATMISSLPIAIESQGAPAAALDENMDKIISLLNRKST